MNRSESAEPPRFQEAASSVIASTVKVWTESGAGTAFYIGEGQFVTAGHVVDGEALVRLTNATYEYNALARVVGCLPEEAGDLAILTAVQAPPPLYTSSPFVPVEWAGELSVGDTIGLAGYPSGFGEADMRRPAAVTRGIVSRLHEENGIAYVQTDAAANPGNSGGPAFDSHGRVAGVVVKKFGWIDDLPAEGLGFAVAEPSLNGLLRGIRDAAAVTLSCEVSQTVVQTGGSAGILCTVTDAQGWPVAGVDVSADISAGGGWIAGSSQAPTDERGQTIITYLAPPTEGLAIVDIQAGTLRASAEVAVWDPSNVSIILSDAPERVDPLSRTAITITVMDDEGVLVGAVPIKVDKIEGDGVVDEVVEITSDGQASFTFLAPPGIGKAAFLVQAGNEARGRQIRQTISVLVGPEQYLEAQPTAWGEPLAPGTWNLVWNGEDGAGPSAGCGEDVVAIWRWNGSGWDGYSPTAAGVPGGNTLNSLTSGAAYWVIVE